MTDDWVIKAMRDYVRVVGRENTKQRGERRGGRGKAGCDEQKHVEMKLNTVGPQERRGIRWKIIRCAGVREEHWRKEEG